MAGKQERKVVTFYLYDYAKKLATKPKKIYSPYNVKTLGRTPSEDYFANPDSVEFKGGIYQLDPEALSNEIYDQQLEWLSFYNPRGGKLSKGGEGQKHINGRFYRNDGIHIIETKKVVEDNVKIKTVTEKVEVQQIPEIIANTLDVKQLQELANAWEVTLPENILEIGDADAIKAKIIETMKESGNIK